MSIRIPVILVLLVAEIQALLLEPRDASARCDEGFGWTENQQHRDSCDLAATVIAPCSQTGSWNIPPMTTIGSHYDPPSTANDTDTDCYCSWAAYNLLSACTACQNFPDGILTWSFFSADCGSHLSTTTYYPSKYALPGNISLPFYATIDPSSWQDQKFNEVQAENVTEGKADVNPSVTTSGSSETTGSQTPQTSPPSHDSAPVGAIAGGVVGGVVALIVAGLFAFWVVLRRRRRTMSEENMGIVRPAHGRSFSDMTQSTLPQPSDFPYTTVESPRLSSIHTHDSGANTLSRFGSIYTTPPHGNSPAPRLSPAPSMDPSLRMSVTSQSQSNLNFQPMASVAEDTIQPFIINHPTTPASSQTNLNRKGGINLQYDSPNSPPVNRPPEDYFEVGTNISSRPRINPPAYSPYPGAAAPPSEVTTPSDEVAAGRRERNGHGHRPILGEKGSSDTTVSPWTSSGSGGLTTTPERSEVTTSPVSPRRVVNPAMSVISGSDNGVEIA